MFDTFPAFSVLLYRKAHNPTKERTPQKGPALFLRQGKLPQPAISQEDQTITTIPSREDSLERLADLDKAMDGRIELLQ